MQCRRRIDLPAQNTRTVALQYSDMLKSKAIGIDRIILVLTRKGSGIHACMGEKLVF
jgi:hypothetical protein